LLCSRCGERVKPIVAIDIDGTLADYHAHFTWFSGSFLDKTLSPFLHYTGAEPYKSWWCNVMNADEATFHAVKLAYRQGGMKRTQPAFAGGRQLVEDLRNHGVEVWLTTTRPHERYDRVDPDTREWLSRRDIKFDALLFSEDKMDELANRVERGRVVAVLDDLAEVLLDAQSHGWLPILRRTKYNRDVEWGGHQVYSLHDAYDEIKPYLEAWERKHG
jgi:hypothetical protein